MDGEISPRRWFGLQLQQLMGQAGVPSGRELADSTRAQRQGEKGPFALAKTVNVSPRELSRSTVNRALTGVQQKPPDWDFVAMFVVSCVSWADDHGRTLLARRPVEVLPRLLRDWQRRLDDMTSMIAQPDTDEPTLELIRVGRLPAAANQFQARGVDLELTAALARGDTAVLTQVLSGGGGVGKTQLAADHARRVWTDPRARVAVWVPAASRDQIISTYARVATGVLDLGEVGQCDPEAAASHLVEWLATTRDRWLIVLDDVHRLEDMRGLWPPNTPFGQTIVTTRRRDSALSNTGRTVIPVGVFTRAQ